MKPPFHPPSCRLCGSPLPAYRRILHGLAPYCHKCHKDRLALARKTVPVRFVIEGDYIVACVPSAAGK
jgi:hypothetical protein